MYLERHLSFTLIKISFLIIRWPSFSFTVAVITFIYFICFIKTLLPKWIVIHKHFRNVIVHMRIFWQAVVLNLQLVYLLYRFQYLILKLVIELIVRIYWQLCINKLPNSSGKNTTGNKAQRCNSLQQSTSHWKVIVNITTLFSN